MEPVLYQFGIIQKKDFFFHIKTHIFLGLVKAQSIMKESSIIQMGEFIDGSIRKILTEFTIIFH